MSCFAAPFCMNDSFAARTTARQNYCVIPVTYLTHQRLHLMPVFDRNTGNCAVFAPHDYQYFVLKQSPRTALKSTDVSILEHKNMSVVKVGLTALVGISMMIAGVVLPTMAKASSAVEPAVLAPAPTGLQSLSTSVSTVSGTTTLTGTVTLTGPAPVGGVKVALKGSSRTESFPAGVIVAAGNSTATFTISSTGVTASRLITLKATSNGVSKEATYTRTP